MLLSSHGWGARCQSPSIASIQSRCTSSSSVAARQATLQQVAATQLAVDAWGSGALLGAMLDCVAGGGHAQRPPAWLYQGFGPLAPVAAPASVGTPFLAPAGRAGAAAAGRRLRYVPHA